MLCFALRWMHAPVIASILALLVGACGAEMEPEPRPAEAGVEILADSADGIASISINATRLSDGAVLYQSGLKPALTDATSGRSYLEIAAVLPADTNVILTANAYDASGTLIASALPAQILTPDPGMSTTAELVIELDM